MSLWIGDRDNYVAQSIEQAYRSIAEVMGDKTVSAEYRKWLFDSYLSTAYPKEYQEVKDLFPEVLEGLSRLTG